MNRFTLTLLGLTLAAGLSIPAEAAPQRSRQSLLRPRQGFHGFRIGWIGCRCLESGNSRIAGVGHGFEGFPLMLHVTLGGFNQVRNQVVAPLQLDVDVAPRGVDPVTAADEPVVDDYDRDY